jgi:hypothetical protein
VLDDADRVRNSDGQAVSAVDQDTERRRRRAGEDRAVEGDQLVL